MARYLITLYVTIEEETAIRELYATKCWLFYKCESKVSDPEITSPLGFEGCSGSKATIPNSVGDVDPDYNVNRLLVMPGEYTAADTGTCKLHGLVAGMFGITGDDSQQKDEGGSLHNAEWTNARSLDRCQDVLGDLTQEKSIQDSQGDELLDNIANCIVSDSGALFQKDQAFYSSDDGGNTCQNGKVQSVSMCGDFLNRSNVLNGEVNSDSSCLVKNKEQELKRMSTRPRIKRSPKRGMDDLNVKNIAQEIEMKLTKNSLKKTRKAVKKIKILKEKEVKIKSKQGKFHCNECNITFKLLGSFNNHKRDGKCVFTCEFCGKVYTSRYYYNYQVHLKYHKKERAHQCDICGKSYIEANALKIHKRKHSNEKPFICDLCGLSFFSSSHLIYHKKSVHSETHDIHQCDLCGAVLSTLGNLRVHKKTVHIDDRPFVCQTCGKAFKTRKALEQKHAKVHENVYPYKCEFNGCGKCFKTMSSLTCHVRRHNNQRSDFCERCGKGFYSKKDLRLHTRIHTGEKPYSCRWCEYSCTLAGNLRKHLKIHEQEMG